MTALKFRGKELTVGVLPRVIGTLTATPAAFPSSAATLPADILEYRLDEIKDSNWLPHCLQIEAADIPVLLTVRHPNEGGKWSGSEPERKIIFNQALQHLAAVDIELQSELAEYVCLEAMEVGKLCVASFHDFQSTPSYSQLEATVAQVQEIASVVKVSTFVRSAADISTLAKLLAVSWKVPLCIIGMGPAGTETRISFPTLGSCFTYGYLDRPAAPGQLSAAELVRQLSLNLPDYLQDRSLRIKNSQVSTSP
jgi:3-dehydroquinate dehydratase-1